MNTTEDLGRHSVRASDGVVGDLDDLYFDEGWTVRYVAIGTGGPISPRRVLVAPRFVGEADAATRILHTELTREQVENVFGIQLDLPAAPDRKLAITLTTRRAPIGPADWA